VIWWIVRSKGAACSPAAHDVLCCWTGAAAWGRVAPLGWRQGDGRETGGCGGLGGEKAGGPGFVGIHRTATRKSRGRSHNPRDGMSRLCRLVGSPHEPRLQGDIEAIFVRDVVELLDEPRGMGLTYGGRWRAGLSTGTAAGELDLAEHCARCAAGGCDSYTRCERGANATDCRRDTPTGRY
jgi:hypothetical protein